MPLPFYIYFLIISILAGITVYFQPSPRYLKIFHVYLILSLTVEFVGYWLAARTGSNAKLYNLYTIVQFSFYLYVLKEVISNETVKQLIVYTTCGFILLSLINVTFVQKLNNWNSVTYASGSLITVAFIIYYFFELFKRPKATDLKKDPAFWICSGLLFFLCCSFPIFGLINFLLKTPRIVIRNLQAILTTMNILLYTLFSIAFLCRVKMPKRIL